MKLGNIAVIAALTLWSVGCTIPENQEFKLGVPHVEQEQFNYCVPASILMWRLYDGLPAVSQDEIFNWLGGAPCTGDEIPAGVNHFTRTTDTFLDLETANNLGDNIRDIVARHITSVGESRIPVIALVRSTKNHVGVINGGKYHFDEVSGLNVWDLVYFHDPAESFGDRLFTASQWLDFFCRETHPHCAQIVSSSAIIGWDANVVNYGNSVSFQGEPVILNQDL